MSTTVARIDAILDVDGRGVPRKVKRLGEQAGRDAGDAFGDEFNDSLDKHLTDWGNTRLDVLRERFKKAGDDSGRLFGTKVRDASDRLIKNWVDDVVEDIARVFTFADSDEWDKWVKNAGSVAVAYQKMRDNIQLAHNEGRLQSETADLFNGRLLNMAMASRRVEVAQERLALKLKTTQGYMERIEETLRSSRSWDRHVRDVGGVDRAYQGLWQRINELEQAGADSKWTGRMRAKLVDLTEATIRAKDSTNDLDRSYRNLPHGFRQAIFWSSLVIAALPDLAVLGSAAGGGILVLGSALSALAIGAGTAFAGFKDLGEKIEDLPASSRPAKEAFDGFVDSLGRLQDKISIALLDDMAPAFDRLRGVVDLLGPSFELVADSVGLAVDDFSRLASSEDGVKRIQGAVEAAAPIFREIADAAGDLLFALLNAFGNEEVQRSTLELIGWIDDLIEKFDEFTQNGGLDEWMQNTRTIFGELGELLGVTGEMLNNLVTPESVGNTADMLDSISGFIPFLEDLFTLVSAANPFGLIAQALETLGTFLSPIVEMFTPIIDSISEVTLLFMELTEVFWTYLSPIFLPLELGWKAVNKVIEKFIEWSEPILTALQEMGEEIVLLGEDIWEDLEPALDDLLDAFLGLLPEPEELARIIREDVIPRIRDFAAWIEDTLVPALKDAIGFIQDVIEALGGWDGIKDKLRAVGLFFQGFSLVVQAALRPITWLIDTISSGIRWIMTNLPQAQAVQGTFSKTGPGLPRNASGTIATRPTVGMYGESGAEAIVPLNRPLDQVSPEVRDLSAYAQGKAGPRLVVESGAFQLVGPDPRATAYEVLDVLAKRIG